MNADELAPLVGALPLFSGLAPEARRDVTRLFVPRRYDAGEAIFRPGEGAHEYLLVLDGRVMVKRPGLPPVERGRGDGFGELGLIPGGTRRAAAHAGPEGCWVARLPRLALDRLVEEDLDGFRPFREALEARLEPLGLERSYTDRGRLVGSPRVVAFGAPRDGVGRTTAAVNYAAMLAISGLQVALVDLDPGGGDVALLTDVEASVSWADFFPETGARPDLSPATLRKALLPAGAGVHVLPAPPTSAAARRPTPQDVERLLQGLGRAYDAVVIDAPSGTGALAECVLRAADLAVVVGVYTYQGVYALNRTLAALGRLGLDGDRVQVLLNQVGRVDDCPAQETEVLLRPPVARLAHDPEVAKAASRSVPDVLARPGGGLAESLRELRKALDDIPRRRRVVRREDPTERRAKGRARVALGRSLFLRGEHARAREHLEAAALALPGDAEAPLLLGRIHEDRGEVRQAGQWYLLAQEADAEDLHPQCRAAYLTRDLEQAGAAMARLRPRRERFPDRADYALLEGLLAEVRGEDAAARAAYATATTIHPGYAEGWRRRGDLERRLGHPAEALQFYQKACQARPVDLAAFRGRVAAAVELGLVGPAHEAMKDLAGLAPDFPEVGRELTELTRRRRAVQDEVAAYDRALARTPDYPDVLLLRAGARLRLGDLRGASRDALKALQRGASLPGARLLLRKVRVLQPCVEDVGRLAKPAAKAA